MSLLDSLGSVLGDVMAGKEINIMQIAETALASSGGMGGLVAQLQQGGLGEQVSSWLGSGANMPVSADQLTSALGHGQLAQLASAFGVDVSALPGLLAQHLPAAVDQASPNGVIGA